MNRTTPRKSRFILLLVVLALLLPASAALADTATTPDQTDLVLRGQVDARPTDGAEGEWTIDGTVIVANERTRFVPDAASIAVGDNVHAVARRSQGELIAVAIAKVQPRPRLLRGEIESIDEAAGIWVIGGKTVIVDDNTHISGDTPAVGAQALAWVVPTDAGLLAKRIVVKGARPPARPITFVGTVVSELDGVWTIAVGDGEKVVQTDDKTRIVGDPVAGDRVGVKGHRFEDGTIIASHIVKLDGEHDDKPFTGFITAVQAEADQWIWTVERPAKGDEPAKTWTVVVTADTKINVDDPAEVEVGAWVKGAGIPIADDETNLAATVVRVTRPPKVRFHGEVTTAPDPANPDFPAGLWVIGGADVHVSADTRIDGDAPALGDIAGGYGALRLDGGIDAALLKTLPADL